MSNQTSCFCFHQLLNLFFRAQKRLSAGFSPSKRRTAQTFPLVPSLTPAPDLSSLHNEFGKYLFPQILLMRYYYF